MKSDMKLTLYMGRAGTGKTQAVYQWIQDKMDRDPRATIFLLVPDSATYKAERDLAECMPQKGFINVRVVGFSRLAYQIYQSLGFAGGQGKGLSDIGRNLLMRLVMKRKASQLDVLNQAARQPQFSDILPSLRQECHSFQVDTDYLRRGAESVESDHLKRKLQELATLFEAYHDALDERNADDREPLEALLAVLPKSPLVSNCYVAVDGYHWFTPLHYQLLFELFDLAKESIITCTLPTNQKVRAAQKYPSALFSRPYEVYGTLYDYYGKAMVIRNFEQNYRQGSESMLSLMEQDYFRSSPIKYTRNSEALQNREGQPVAPFLLPDGMNQVPIFAAYNRERECDAVARDLVRYIQEDASHRWRDLMIILRDDTTYPDILAKALQAYDIPYFMDRQRPMKTHPLAELLTSLFAVVRSNYDHDSIFRLLKTDLVLLNLDSVDAVHATRQAVDELENYCLEFGVHHFQWSAMGKTNSKNEAEGFAWKWHRKGRGMTTAEEARLLETGKLADGMRLGPTGHPIDEDEFNRLQRVNATHDAIMDWLDPWFDFAKDAGGHTGYAWGQYIFTLLERLDVPTTLFAWAQDAAEAGDQAGRASHGQMYRQVLNFLDEVMSIAHDDVLTLDEMELLLNEGLEDVKYSMVPPSLDHVLVTTIERGYTQERPYVYIMGLNEGIFPQRMGDEGLLKDKDRDALQAAGIELAGGALQQAFNENFLLYLACTRASKGLTLSYAHASENGEGMEASLVVKRMQTMGYVAPEKEIPITIAPGTEKEYLWNAKQSLSLLSARWGQLLDGSVLEPIWWGLYEWARKSQAYRPRLAEVTRGIRDNNIVPLINQDVVNGLFLPNHRMVGSVTRLETYGQCPFKFFAQYGLRLNKRKVRSFGSPEIGTLVHEYLRMIGERLMAQGKQWRDSTLDELHALCDTVVEKQEAQLRQDYVEQSAFDQALQERITRTLYKTVDRLADWSHKSDFNMVAVEQSFGTAEGWPSIPIDLGKNRYLNLTGQIDRIDMWEDAGVHYGAIIDYKTGNASISATDVYYGLKYQLITYLMALAMSPLGKDSYAAGTMYMPVRNPKVSASQPITEAQALNVVKDKSSLKTSGYYTDSIPLLSHMDQLIYQVPTEYIPVKLKKDGELDSYSKPRTKTVGEFDILMRYTKHKMAEMGQAIGKGRFAIAPYRKGKGSSEQTACKYCDFQAVCRFDRTRNRFRNLETFGNATKQENLAMDKMRQALGIQKAESQKEVTFSVEIKDYDGQGGH